MTDKPTKGDAMLDAVLKTDNPEFRAWVESLPKTYWARYDLGAARIGWEAARASTPPPSAPIDLAFAERLIYELGMWTRGEIVPVYLLEHAARLIRAFRRAAAGEPAAAEMTGGTANRAGDG